MLEHYCVLGQHVIVCFVLLLRVKLPRIQGFIQRKLIVNIVSVERESVGAVNSAGYC
jgi:hypothetical protein